MNIVPQCIASNEVHSLPNIESLYRELRAKAKKAQCCDGKNPLGFLLLDDGWIYLEVRYEIEFTRNHFVLPLVVCFAAQYELNLCLHANLRLRISLEI